MRKAESRYLKDSKVRLYVSTNHIADLLDCVKARKKPITSEQVGARSAICCHLLNQTLLAQVLLLPAAALIGYIAERV